MSESSATQTATLSSFSQNHLPTAEISDEDDVFSVVENFIDSILNAADSDEAETIVRQYLDQALQVSLQRYSTRNRLSIISQLHNRDVDYKHDAVHFAGYQTWIDEYNRHVKEGESGYKILAPRTGTVCPNCGNTPNYHSNRPDLDCPKAGTDPSSWSFDPHEQWDTGILYFTTATTFAFPQTEPLDDADPEDVFTPADIQHSAVPDGTDYKPLFSHARSVIKNEGYTVEVRDPTINEHGKNGTSSGGEIFVKDRSNVADQFRTLIHEYAHELLHQRDDGPVDWPNEVLETEAETVAYAVCSFFGIDASNSQFYIRSMIDQATINTQDDAAAHDLVKDRLIVIQETATEIINQIESGSTID